MTRSDVRMLPAGGSPGNQLVRLRQVKEVPGILSWGLETGYSAGRLVTHHLVCSVQLQSVS